MSPTLLVSWQRSMLYLTLRAPQSPGPGQGGAWEAIRMVCDVRALQAEHSWLLPPTARPDTNHIEGFETVCSNGSDHVAKHECKQGSRSQAFIIIQTELHFQAA